MTHIMKQKLKQETKKMDAKNSKSITEPENEESEN